MDPWSVLNVSKESTPEEISSSYRKLMLKYHPDKSRNLPEQERQLIYTSIQNAYDFLRKIPRFQNMPDYKMTYTVDTEVTNPVTNPFNIKVTKNNFNNVFEKIKEQEAKDGFVDPNSIGRIPQHLSASNLPPSGVREEINIPQNQQFKPRNELVKHNPLENPMALRSKFANNFGLTTIDDYSISIGSKKSVVGSDILHVYSDVGYETATMALEKDQTLKSRYDNGESLEFRMKQRETMDVRKHDTATTNNYIKFTTQPQPQVTQRDLHHQLQNDTYLNYLESRRLGNS